MSTPMEETAIQSTASGPSGVSWIELWVNGELVETTQAPTPLRPMFSAIQRWQPTSPGEHLIEVRAYDENGVSSPPANIVLRVSGADVDPQQTQVPPEAARVPTATRPTAPQLVASTPTLSGACEPGARYVEDITVPDETQFVVGTEFGKTWRVLNSGSCTWGADYRLVFVSGDQMGGPDEVPVPETNPQAEVDLSVDLVSPDEPGTYAGYWRVSTLDGEPFGSSLFVKIVVVSPTATPEPTAAATPTLSASPTGSN
jgi:hypothetical protein